ncbi:uncharacterized protein E0L32_008958 [Thyridium curvatum]|uniref:CENP-V/GFA domain-containing protein n=1 Tax=Thyridium curvatum TaxID=1093900 RepID=A0A507AQS1_9PEZI|nr:uncharacterized protein E0L32_008958 [Thyridium curvatum]TPX09767.1 hypothetical protein E0L32_008958 [Thyridium curvatum]
MSLERPLRGGCQCGRNRYIIERPQNASQLAQVLFDTGSSHSSGALAADALLESGTSLASPLAAFIRVPLEWYHSTTFAFFPDETNATIRKVYTHPSEQHAKRHFCGFCGTPLSYWSEQPRSEADFISLTLGSLCREDLGDLEDMGLIPDRESPTPPVQEETSSTSQPGPVVVHESRGVPWFDSMVEGSQLGKLRTSKGSGHSRDGMVTYEWEVVEWTADDELDAPSPAKKQRQDTGDEDAAMEGSSR